VARLVRDELWPPGSRSKIGEVVHDGDRREGGSHSQGRRRAEDPSTQWRRVGEDHSGARGQHSTSVHAGGARRRRPPRRAPPLPPTL